jgi:hypothetical protein
MKLKQKNMQQNQVIKAWKLLRQMKDGSLSPLFINKKQRLQSDIWYPAEAHKTKGFAFRPGWHTCKEPVAPHLSNKGRVWKQVEIQDFVDIKRPESQGGVWYLANKMRII